MNEMDSESQWNDLEQELAEGLERLQRSPADSRVNREVGNCLWALHRYREALGYYENAAAGDPQEPNSWYTLGIAAAHTGALDTAEQALEQAIALGSDEGPVRAALASVLQRLHRPTAAIEQASQALQLPLDPTVRYRLHSLIGACSAEIGDAEGALVHLQEAVREDPENVAAQHNLGMAYLWRGHHAPAIRHLEKTVALEPHHPGAWYDLGRAARQADALEMAKQAFEKAIELGRDGGELRAELAWVLQGLDQPIAAIEHANRALQFPLAGPMRGWAHAILASCYAELGDTAAELEQRQQVVKVDPEDAAAQFNLGAAYYKCQQYEAAVPHLEKAATLAPEDLDTWYALGSAASLAGDLEKARDAFERALTLRGDDAQTRKDLASVLQSLEEYEAAIRQADEALQVAVEPQLQARLHEILWYSHARLENAAAALHHLQEAVRLDPADAYAQYNLGLEYRERDDFQAALPHLERATALAPEDRGYQFALAQLYTELDYCEQAEPILRQLLSSDHHDSAHILLVKCVLKRGQAGEALHLARTEVEANPEAAVAWAALSVARRASGDRAGAREALHRAEALDEQNPWVRWEVRAASEKQVSQ